MKSSFATSLQFVWREDFDSPAQGYHVTPGDAGGGTFGGVTEATWKAAVTDGVVQGTLKRARVQYLSDILEHKFWGDLCDALPVGVDFMVFNGRMLTGRYPALLQQCLGFIEDDCDNAIGPQTLGVAALLDAETLIHSLTGVHYDYLTRLQGWHEFGKGWTARLKAASGFALNLRNQKKPPPLVKTA